jgi:hypothetical protein
MRFKVSISVTLFSKGELLKQHSVSKLDGFVTGFTCFSSIQPIGLFSQKWMFLPIVNSNRQRQ